MGLAAVSLLKQVSSYFPVLSTTKGAYRDAANPFRVFDATAPVVECARPAPAGDPKCARTVARCTAVL